MVQLGADEQAFLQRKNHARAVAHLRAQLRLQRFGLVVGAGVSKDLHYPDWEELIERIAADRKVKGTAILGKKKERKDTHASRTQLLYQLLKARVLARRSMAKVSAREAERIVDREWLAVIYNSLYKNVDTTKPIAKQHAYLGEFVSVIQRAKLTVNYNFDDVLERLLAESQPPDQSRRTYETVWTPVAQPRGEGAVIYHPNGYLPSVKVERQSGRVIFKEDAFADQLIATMAGYYSSLLNHLFKNTCLFVGVSLDDATLRHLLRQNATINPGHYHYFIAFVDDKEKLDEAKARTIKDANFDVFNLITLFLNRKEIAALGRLLSADSMEFKRCAEEAGQETRYCYYVCGPVGVGKSTIVAQFGSLVAHDEWPERRNPLLAKKSDSLTPKQRKAIDVWVSRMFGLKNVALIEEREGIHIIDRSPLDPLAFTPPRSVRPRAKLLRQHISPQKSHRAIHPGMVVFLEAEPAELYTRSRSFFKEATVEYLGKQQGRLKSIFGLLGPHPIINTGAFSLQDATKQVARLIHCEDYSPGDLDKALTLLADGKGKH